MSVLEHVDKWQAEIERLQTENARLAAVLDDIGTFYYDRYTLQQKIQDARKGGSDSLRDLLAPTIELLESAVKVPTIHGPDLNLAHYDLDISLLDKELSRLQSMVGRRINE